MDEEKRRQRTGMQIRVISNLLKRNLDCAARQNGVDRVTAAHGWAIKFFLMHRDREMFQRDLEKEFSIRRSTATGILQLMEKDDLIVREPVPYDARLKKITLTPKAVAMNAIIEENIDRTEEKMVEGFTDEEKATLVRLLERVRKNLEE